MININYWRLLIHELNLLGTILQQSICRLVWWSQLNLAGEQHQHVLKLNFILGVACLLWSKGHLCTGRYYTHCPPTVELAMETFYLLDPLHHTCSNCKWPKKNLLTKSTNSIMASVGDYQYQPVVGVVHLGKGHQVGHYARGNLTIM